MKKTLLIVLAIVAYSSVIAQQNIPNGDLESWYTVSGFSYEQPGTGPSTGNWLLTLNDLAQLPFPGPITTFKTTEANTGNYAAKLVSNVLPFLPNDIFLPGMLGTCEMLMTQNKAILGKPCAECKPSKFTGYFKYFPVNGDSAAAVIVLSRWNTVTKHRDTLGISGMVLYDTVPAYLKVEMPVTYFSTNASDTITILCVASAGFNAIEFSAGKGKVGSTLYVDDIALEYPSGIQQSLMPEVGVNTYPNPASDIMNVELSKQVRNGMLEVYNAAGKLMGTWPCSQLKNTIPVYSLTPGTYYFRLMEGKGMLNTGSFSVRR